MNKTGIELIAQERQEQIEKHGWDAEHDAYNDNKELIQACLFCLDHYTGPGSGLMTYKDWPMGWLSMFKDKILKKDDIGKLKVAGAFIAAEIDRLQAQSSNSD